MPVELVAVLAVGVFLVAVLYSSVGHAGASGYIAVMSLLALTPEVIKPTALSLNILVASIATYQFFKAGHFSWRLFWPFGVLAIPFAYLGGHMSLPAEIFKTLVGLILLFSAYRFFFQASQSPETRDPPLLVALAAGGGIGFLSGLTGTGGGIFLTPLLLFMGWAGAKQAAAVSALFVLVNSIAGLLGNIAATAFLPSYLFLLLTAAGAGGFLGSRLGSRRIQAVAIKRLLAIVLLIAGLKLIFA
jgi:uncharacterized protein